LIDNGHTNENIEFVLMAIDAVMDGGSVDVDEKIINELTGKAKCVYDKVFSKNITSLGIMQQTYIAFNPDLNYKEHYLTYSSKPLSGTINGETKVNSPISYEIILNDQTLNNRAPIEIARTILHESVHALLLKQAYGNGTESFIQIFKNYISSTTGNNDLHHDIKRNKYIIPIAKGLEKYDNSSEDFSY